MLTGVDPDTLGLEESEVTYFARTGPDLRGRSGGIAVRGHHDRRHTAGLGLRRELRRLLTAVLLWRHTPARSYCSLGRDSRSSSTTSELVRPRLWMSVYIPTFSRPRGSTSSRTGSNSRPSSMSSSRGGSWFRNQGLVCSGARISSGSRLRGRKWASC